MIVSANDSLRYEWREDWAQTPAAVALSQENGRTHGVAEARDGSVYVFHQSDPAVLVFDSEGNLSRSFGSDFIGAHGLTLYQDKAGTESLWLTDQDTGRVARLSLDGAVLQTIAKPDHPIYSEKRYAPTHVAVNPESEEIFVTDGYGSGLIHRYDRDGAYLSSLSGEEGAGRFNCPHAIYFDVRGGKQPELYVADRGNKRVQVYDAEGSFTRSFGTDFLIAPCAFAAYEELLYVPELFGRVAVLDGNDRLLGYVGEDKSISGDLPRPKGYPNLRKPVVQPGKFVAPHGVGTGKGGTVYIAEWIIGGRVTKLVPQP